MKGAFVYILADNDEPGKQVAQRIFSDLEGIAEDRKIIVPMPNVPKADITDYFNSGKKKEDLEKLLKNAAPGIPKEIKSPRTLLEMLTCINASERFKRMIRALGPCSRRFSRTSTGIIHPARISWCMMGKDGWTIRKD